MQASFGWRSLDTTCYWVVSVDTFKELIPSPSHDFLGHLCFPYHDESNLSAANDRANFDSLT